jgi:hypothetical protein
MTKLLLFMAVACASAFAQSSANPPPIPQYCSTSGDVTLSGAGTTFTIQMPAGSGKSAVLMAAIVTTSVASSFTQAANGTNATTTAGTVTQSPTTAPTVTGKAVSFTASNVGAGTAIAGKIVTPAASGLVIDLTNGNNYNLVLKPVANSNYSIVIASMTGTANATVCWREQ